MDLYYRVAKVVAPKRASLATAQARLDETNAKLRMAQEQLQEVEDKLAALQACSPTTADPLTLVSRLSVLGPSC